MHKSVTHTRGAKIACRALEISFGLTLLVISEGIDAIEHGRLLCKNLGIFDEVLPFNRVQLFEVL